MGPIDSGLGSWPARECWQLRIPPRRRLASLLSDPQQGGVYILTPDSVTPKQQPPHMYTCLVMHAGIISPLSCLSKSNEHWLHPPVGFLVLFFA